MKYKFVYDESLSELFFELTEEERIVVIATVVGGHNAIFTGYKPERLVKAVKKLTELRVVEPKEDVSITDFCGGGPEIKQGLVSEADGGMLIMNNIDEFRSSVVQMLEPIMDSGVINLSRAGRSYTFPAHFQLIATMRACPCGCFGILDKPCLCSAQTIRIHWNRVSSVIDKCGIVYRCYDDNPTSTVNIGYLRDLSQRVWNRHCNRAGNAQKDVCMTLVDLTKEARIYRDDTFGDSYPMVERVARTIADMKGHNMTWTEDLKDAKKWYNPVDM